MDLDIITTFYSNTKRVGACLVWQGTLNRDGYGIWYRFLGEYGTSSFLAHRIAWAISEGQIEDGMHVLHKCDNPACVDVNHLFLGTPQDNHRDKQMKGRARNGWATDPEGMRRRIESGEIRTRGPHIPNDVRLEIRRMYESGLSQVEIGARYNVAQTTVSNIVREAS